MSAGAWLGGDRARAMGGGKLLGGCVEVFGAGGEGAVMAHEGGSLDSELLHRPSGTQPRVTRQTSLD